MKAIVSRVLSAEVEVSGEKISEIGMGFTVYLGIGIDDTEEKAKILADKICNLRIFEDSGGKMNLSALTIKAQLLIIPNFTLYADCSSRRPGFSGAARPDKAESLYNSFITYCRDFGIEVLSGRFGADMKIAAVYDGPVNIIIEI